MGASGAVPLAEVSDGEAPAGAPPGQVANGEAMAPPSLGDDFETGPMPSGNVASPAESTGGCSVGTLTSGNHAATLEHDGQTREYLVHVPESYEGDTAVPLVLDLHGLTSSAGQQAALSGWRDKADEVGFIVVHPEGLNASWNGGDLCCGNSRAAGVDDEGFMRAIVERLKSDACIDPKRVYATGLSNGGAMAHLLACRAADVFAATAPVSMGNGVQGCAPSRPISVVMTRGTSDPLVAYDGGLFPGAVEDFEAWSQLNACPGAPQVSDEVCETRSDCAGGVEVTLCTLAAGHVLYANSEGFSVPDVVWSTFERQALP
jgi:polyhydroxybutyrate depolymerase